MSNTKLLARMSNFNNSFKATSGTLFLRLLDDLCKAHHAYPFVNEIHEALGNWDQMMRVADSLSSQKYEDYKTHFVANQFSLLIRKNPLAKLRGVCPEAAAVAKFMAAENLCKRTNQRFRCFVRRSPRELLLSEMRAFIQYVLGPAPSDAEVASAAGFGPGASIGVHRATNFARKLLADKWSVTSGAFDVGFNAVMHNPTLSEILFREGQEPYNLPPRSEAAGLDGCYCVDPDIARSAYVLRASVVNHNKIVFVAKTAKVHRTIAVEPLLNGYMQKGVDAIMKEKLKRIGFNLLDQRVNQLYAKFGSEDWLKDDGFCTIDLASASDSVSTELVRAVLPPDWFDLLNRLRSKRGTIAGKEIAYEKFCSMGNGFCFPLETLIFGAICHASGAGKPRLDYVVYGDDIIVRRKVAEAVIGNLRYCGLRLNIDKTHVSGPFRESCGEDYFAGVAVRPFTLDFELNTLVDIIKLLNLVQRNTLTRSFFRCIDYTTFGVPPDLRFVRPVTGNADAAVTVELDTFMSSPFAKWNSALHCWDWMEVSSTAKKDNWFRGRAYGHIAHMYAALAGSSSASPFAFRRETKMKVRRMAYSASSDSLKRPF